MYSLILYITNHSIIIQIIFGLYDIRNCTTQCSGNSYEYNKHMYIFISLALIIATSFALLIYYFSDFYAEEKCVIDIRNG